MNQAADIYHILAYAGASTFLLSAILLLFQARHGKSNPRARRVLAVCLLVWTTSYLPSCFVLSSIPLIDFQPLSIFSLIGGNFFTLLSLPFLLELTRPGWVTFQKIVLLSLPYLIVTAIYFTVLIFLRLPIITMNNANEVLNNIGTFNVWYRFVFYLSNCFYLAFLFLNINPSILRHSKRNNGDTTPTPRKLVRWLHFYNTFAVISVCSYVGVFLYGNIESYVIQSSVSMVFTWIIIYIIAFTRFLDPETVRK